MFEKTRYLMALMALLLVAALPVMVYAAEEAPPTPEPGGRITAPDITGVNPDPEPEEGQLSEIEASGSVQQQSVKVPVSSEAPLRKDVAQEAGGQSPVLGYSLAVPMRHQDSLDASCGVQALGMAMDYLAQPNGEKSPTSGEMLTQLSAGGLLYAHGTGVEELAYLARQNGYAGSYAFHQWTLPKLQEELKQGKPVIVSLGVNGEGKPGHFVTVTGVSDDGQWVSYNDPAKGKMTVPVSEFLVEWSWQGYAGMVTQREALAAEADPMLPVMGMFSALSALTVMASQQPWRKDIVAKVTAMQDVLTDPERLGIGGRRRRSGRRSRRRRPRRRRRVRARRPRRPPRRPPRRRVVKPKPRPKPRVSASQRRAKARRRAAAEARRRAQEVARRRVREEARRRAAVAQRKEQMARQAALLAAQRKAEAAARRKASLEAELKAEREARLQAAEEARRREQEEARRRAEEAQRKEQMARQAALLKAKLEAEAAARRKASLEAKLKAEREARIKAQAEAANRARAQQEANTAMQVELLRYQRNQPSQQSLADWRQQDMAVADQQVNVRREAETATQVELLRHQQNRSQRQRLAEWKQQDMAIADQRVNIRREAETATQIELLRNQRNRPRLQSLADWKQQDMAEVERYRQQQATAQEVSVPSFWSNSVGWLQAQLINAGRKNETIKEVLVGANNATNAFNQTVGQPIRNTFNAGVQVYGNWVSNPNRPFDLFNKNWWQQKVVVPVVSGVATFVDRATQGAQGLLNLGVYGLHRASQGAQGLLNLGVYGLNRAAQASQAIVSGVGAIVNETVVKPITNGLRAWSGVFENSREIVKALPGYLEEKAKNALTKVITSNAERLYLNRYVPVASWTQQHPFATKFLELVMNTLMNPVRNKVLETLNTDPNTMTWTDIGLSWLFELGQFENDQIVFGPDAVTTKEVMGLDGVVEARQEAIKKIAAGRLDQVVSECATDREIFTGMPQNGEYPVCWSYLYNVPEYYRSLSKASRGGLSEVYIGGYRTYITVEPKGNGVYVFHYEVHNPSTWESGTRFRKDSEDADELNDAIIPSVKPRGEGIHLGGKQDQIWTWDETVDLSGGAKP